MEKPSAFSTWLRRQTAREDEVGQLAGHAAQDERWPWEAARKEELRAYLRAQKRKPLIAPLAMAWEEFAAELAEAFGEQTRSEGWELSGGLHLVQPLLIPWLDLGSPGCAEVEKMAEEGHATALAIFGARLGLGVMAPANWLLARTHLERAFELGCVPAAAVLQRYGDWGSGVEMRQDWGMRGARLGDLDCLRGLCTRRQLERVAPILPLDAEFMQHELPLLVEKYLGDTGELEFFEALVLCLVAEREAEGLELLRVARAKGWLPAYQMMVDLLAPRGEMEEVTSLTQEGAAAGEYSCAARLAGDEIGRRRREERYEVDAQSMEAVRQLEAAAEHGLHVALASLARFYARGEHVPADEEKAETFWSASFLAVQTAEERDEQVALLCELLPERELRFDLEPGARWLCACARKWQTALAITAATRAWVALGMEVPAAG